MFKGKFEMEECRAEKNWADFYKIRRFKIVLKKMFILKVFLLIQYSYKKIKSVFETIK